MKLATQDKPFFPSDYKEKFFLIRDIGFEAFEIDGKELVDHFEEVKMASEQTGIVISTACGGYEGWIGDFDEKRRRQGIEQMSEILRALGEIGGQGIVVPAAWGMFSKRLPPLVPPRSESEDRQILLKSLGVLNEVGKETNTIVYLEPLNRYEDYMINRLEDAQSLIEEGNFSNVKIIADFFHMNIEEPMIGESLTKAQAHVGHVHLADSNRFQPGNAHLNFALGFKALQEFGYKGYFAYECRVLGEEDHLALYRESVHYIKEIWNETREKQAPKNL